MLKSFCISLTCLLIICIHYAVAMWEFAITTNSRIILYDNHWKEINSAAHQFDELSAITFDEAAEILYFNDQQLNNNASIFSLKIPKTERNFHLIDNIIERTKNESISSIAHDPLNEVLYWADSHNRKVYYASLIATSKKPLPPPKVLLDFTQEDTIPDGIAIDICRRKLYFTNSNFKNATIESVNLDGTNRTVTISSGLFLPHGIAIDQVLDRLYWVNDQQGIYFSIESSNLDGSNRAIVWEGSNNIPLNLVVASEAIFWTDLTNNAVWAYSKYPNRTAPDEPELDDHSLFYKPHKILSFIEERPRGIVARTRYLSKLANDQHCSQIIRNIRSRVLSESSSAAVNDNENKYDAPSEQQCLNEGEYNRKSDNCICKIGYSGARCEIYDCHDYCMHGTCSISSMGYPVCDCQKGFYGRRCQSYKCSSYCLNGGRCSIIEHSSEAECDCPENYFGQRCEQNSTEICLLYCRILKYEPNAFAPFGCHDICQELLQQTEDGENIALPYFKQLESCKSPTSAVSVTWNPSVVFVLVGGIISSLALIAIIIHGLRRFYKPARPRIKKTFIVRKQAAGAGVSSDTPLTNRPLATEQCEITIENCCNMNICDTPCFDPKLVQETLSRNKSTLKEDKKTLINHMEEDLQ